MSGFTRAMLGLSGFLFVIVFLLISYQHFNGGFPGAKPEDIYLFLGWLGVLSFISLFVAFYPNKDS